MVFKGFWVLHIQWEQFQRHYPHQDQCYSHHFCYLIIQMYEHDRLVIFCSVTREFSTSLASLIKYVETWYDCHWGMEGERFILYFLRSCESNFCVYSCQSDMLMSSFFRFSIFFLLCSWYFSGKCIATTFIFLDYVFSLSWLEVKGSKLTDGARALAKHLNKSSDGYWGTFCGSGKFPRNKHLKTSFSCI